MAGVRRGTFTCVGVIPYGKWHPIALRWGSHEELYRPFYLYLYLLYYWFHNKLVVKSRRRQRCQHLNLNSRHISFLFLFLIFSFLCTVTAVLCTIHFKFLIDWLINCWEPNGTTMCGMMTWDRKLSNHIFRLLFKHGVSPCWATLRECQNVRRIRCQADLNSFPLENWRRPPGRPRTTWMKTTQQDLESLNLSLNEAIDVAQNHPLWRMMSMFGATHS